MPVAGLVWLFLSGMGNPMTDERYVLTAHKKALHPLGTQGQGRGEAT